MATNNSNWNLKEKTFLVIGQKDDKFKVYEITCSATVSDSVCSKGDSWAFASPSSSIDESREREKMGLRIIGRERQ